jgi:hypothetical protein
MLKRIGLVVVLGLVVTGILALALIGILVLIVNAPYLRASVASVSALNQVEIIYHELQQVTIEGAQLIHEVPPMVKTYHTALSDSAPQYVRVGASLTYSYKGLIWSVLANYEQIILNNGWIPLDLEGNQKVASAFRFRDESRLLLGICKPSSPDTTFLVFLDFNELSFCETGSHLHCATYRHC